MLRLRVRRAIQTSVLLAWLSATASAQSAVRARVAGAVFDSLSMKPLSGAVVRIVRTDDPSIGRSATTDSTGAFAYDSVAAGGWLATFLHPVLDSLRLEPGIVRLEIADTGSIHVPLFTPSARSLVAVACGTGTADDLGVVVGAVRDANDDGIVVGATVELRWPEWTLAKRKLITDQRTSVARSDSLGRFVMCGVPAGSTLLGVAWLAADSTGVVEVSIPTAAYAVQDFAIDVHQPATAVALVRADTTAPRERTGAAIVRGRVVTPEGRPLANAIVRVLGSGSPARTSQSGAFVIADAGVGTRSVEARAIGFQPYQLPVQLRTTVPTEVTLTLVRQNVMLDTVRVVRGRELPAEVLGIERRWRTGLGRHLNATMIRERASVFVTDAMRGMAGVSVRQQESGYGQAVMMRGFAGNDCVAQVYVDGLRTQMGGRGGFTIDDFVSLDNVAAVEVYARANLVPPEYMTLDGGCGVIAIWTKYATGGVRIEPPKSERR